MNAVRVKLALLGAAAAAAAGGCSRAVEEPAPPLPAPRLETPADWPVYRGDRRLVGRAEGSVPDRLAVRWTFRAGGPIFSSVVVQDGLAVFGANDGKVYAVGTDDGKERWSRDLGQDVEATPCLVGDAAYVGCADGMLYALDLAGGDVRWTYEAEDRVLGAANWVPAPDGTNVWILIGSYDARLHCVDARTGEPAWTFETDNYINGSPAVDGDLAFFGGCDELVHGIRTADGSEAMSVNVGSYVAGSPAVDNGVVYAGHYGGALVAVDLEGERVLWSYESEGDPFFSTPAVGADTVFIGGRDQRLHAVWKADGTRRWIFTARDSIDSGPILIGDTVVVGSDDGRLYLVRASDGGEVWSYDTGAAISASPTPAGGLILIGNHDGTLFAFGTPAGS